MKSKTRHVYTALRDMIEAGDYPDGTRLPSETQLAARYAVSRPTVASALAELVREGYVVRRPGSGTFVTIDRQTVSSLQRKTFGLLSPKLGEVFEPISGRIASLSHQNNFNLLWSTPGEGDAEASASFYVTAAERFVESGIDGVFLVPLEYFEAAETANRTVVEHLEEAGVTIVLIDSDICVFPQRSRYDLVGIDNVRTAYEATKHYLSQGAERVDFVVRPYSHSTVPERIYGYQLALLHHGITPEKEWIHRGNAADTSFVEECLRRGSSNVICQNDATAIEFMHALTTLGVAIPEQTRVIGFDDVRYSRLARVPLTTSSQPCEDIGSVAVEMMLRRLAQPKASPLSVQLQPSLVVRASSVLPAHHGDPSVKVGVKSSNKPRRAVSP